MRLLTLIIYVILFYIIWKFIRVFIKSLKSSRKENPDIKDRGESQSKYKDIEEAKYTEIKDEDKDKENKQ